MRKRASKYSPSGARGFGVAGGVTRVKKGTIAHGGGGAENAVVADVADNKFLIHIS